MAIVKQYHKDTDTTYVYESVSYWDEEKKQSRSKRRVIGKIDPETGEIVPTGKRGRRPKEAASTVPDVSGGLLQLYKDSQARIRELALAIDRKDQEIAGLQKEIRLLKDTLRQIDRHLSQCRDLCADQAPRS
jgi:hypothetical protein